MYSRGKTVSGTNATLKTVKNNLQHSRFGFSVSVKVSKRAVVRNKIKRRMRAAVSKVLSKVPAGNDVVIIARLRSASAEYQVIEKEIYSLLKKARLLK